MIVGTAQEAEAVGKNLQRSFTEHQTVHLRPLLEDLEDEVLLLQPGVLGDVLLFGENDQFFHRQPLEFSDVDVALATFDLLVPLVIDEVRFVVVIIVIVIDHRRCCGLDRDWRRRDDERRFTGERERRSGVGVIPVGSDGWIAATDGGTWFHGSENSRRENSGLPQSAAKCLP